MGTLLSILKVQPGILVCWLRSAGGARGAGVSVGGLETGVGGEKERSPPQLGVTSLSDSSGKPQAARAWPHIPLSALLYSKHLARVQNPVVSLPVKSDFQLVKI